MMHNCYRFVVIGRVQGVFFRASSRDEAKKLGLTGWVRNLKTGGVELVACGDISKIEKLKEWLWQGPKFADVTEVRSECLSETSIDAHMGFEIHGDG